MEVRTATSATKQVDGFVVDAGNDERLDIAVMDVLVQLLALVVPRLPEDERAAEGVEPAEDFLSPRVEKGELKDSPQFEHEPCTQRVARPSTVAPSGQT